MQCASAKFTTSPRRAFTSAMFRCILAMNCSSLRKGEGWTPFGQMQIGDRPVVAWLLCSTTLSRGCNNKNAERLGRNNTCRLRFVSRRSFAPLFSDLFPLPFLPLIVPPRSASRSSAVLSSMCVNAHFYDDIKYDYSAFSRRPRAAGRLAGFFVPRVPWPLRARLWTVAEMKRIQMMQFGWTPRKNCLRQRQGNKQFDRLLLYVNDYYSFSPM